MKSLKKPIVAAKKLGALRSKKLKALKLKISAGKYKVDSEELAKALFLAK